MNAKPWRLSLMLVALNLAAWAIVLGRREATPWLDLEERRPRVTATGGIAFNANSAWGTPLFGREIGGNEQPASIVIHAADLR